MNGTFQHRATIRALARLDESAVVEQLQAAADISPQMRRDIGTAATDLVKRIRSGARPGLMEVFLEEYGLSTREGVALMCLAEALLRVPDALTIDALIEDKIAPSDWGRHLGQSSSSLVNASTWALMLTGKVLDDRPPGLAGTLLATVRRLGEPVIRTAVSRAMKEMGRQFVLGRTISEALDNARSQEAQGYTYSYDMLGEAALTATDATRYFESYRDAIASIARAARGDDMRDRPGISIKLSALHPRYEFAQRTRVLSELVPRVLELVRAAASAGIGLNIDAEEADRLELSLEVIEAVLPDPALAGWDGFGVVVQAYGRRATGVIDWLDALAAAHGRRIMVRLVKGAYWDTEIKLAQTLGLPEFPVFTRKAATDASYIVCASKLLGASRIYPQFATHNAHSVAAVLGLAGNSRNFEFQRLHGMGERLHDLVLADAGTRCRIYAPVGAHRDLLAYLVRRLLENGANSSFVNQIVDEDVPPEDVAADPFTTLAGFKTVASPVIAAPDDIYRPERRNAQGFDLRDPATIEEMMSARAAFEGYHWQAEPMLAASAPSLPPQPVQNPARPDDSPGNVAEANAETCDVALAAAKPWDATPQQRADVLQRAADLYEEHAAEFWALAAREAGKTLADAVSEVREAVDFLRYYAVRGTELTTPARGVFTCISPWNFPLAIFTGQIAGALSAGNAVLAKPAETTPLIAARATALLHAAGVPRSALQLLPGSGAIVGGRLTSDPRVDGVAFTGSTATAQAINRAMADHLSPAAPLIAETGGLNAMIVDSTALPEQAVKDIIASAFQSAGQRCSALRVLYLQDDVADTVLTMLKGAMAELVVGDPLDLATDVGPVIDEAASGRIKAHIDAARRNGRLLVEIETPGGLFVPPTLLKINGIDELEQEIFGPVLHVARFRAADLPKVVEAINATGYGLTFGLHTRIDDRVEEVLAQIEAGNIYVNRNQIGAIVGSQPFGGEGLSGTGPKAGGPAYVPRFATDATTATPEADIGPAADFGTVAAVLDAARSPDIALETRDLPGPVGESNRWSSFGRGPVLCLGPGPAVAAAQADAARLAGCVPVIVTPGGDADAKGVLAADALGSLQGFAAVAYWGPETPARAYRQALAARDGAILPLLAGPADMAMLRRERHICIDTTAAGGNAALLAEVGAED